MPDSNAFLDDEDLPDDPAPPPPKDPETGRFVSPSPKAAPPQKSVQPQHDPYLITRAEHYGIQDASTMSPAELSRMLSFADAQDTRLRQETARRQPEPTPPVEAKEPPIDWGRNNDGTPRSEADLVTAGYDPVVIRSIKQAHAAEWRAEQADKRARAAEERAAQTEQRQQGRSMEAHLRHRLAEHPELFGDKPGRMPANSVEQRRYLRVMRGLTTLPAEEKTTFDGDIDAEVALFGGQKPAGTKPAAKPALDAYRNGELARTTHRRSGNPQNRRETEIAKEEDKRRESGAYFAPSADDDDDLLD